MIGPTVLVRDAIEKAPTLLVASLYYGYYFTIDFSYHFHFYDHLPCDRHSCHRPSYESRSYDCHSYDWDGLVALAGFA